MPNINDTLWCIHIPGPDDVYAEPSHDAAIASARIHNDWLGRTLGLEPRTEHHVPLECLMAFVTPWPWSAESHTAAVARRKDAA